MQQQHSGSKNFRVNMHQRQERSAAQNKMQQGKLSFEKTLKGSIAQKRMQQGKIFFERTVTASSLPPLSQVFLPALFVQQHGDKFKRTVTLKNVDNDKKWTVGINVLFPQNGTQCLLYYGWKAFATANGLALGDRLAFVLVAPSLFDVYILRRGGNSSLFVKKPKIRSHEPKWTRRETKPEAKLCPGPQINCDIPTDGCEGLELARTGTLLKKETTKETRVGTVLTKETATQTCDETLLTKVTATQTYAADVVASEAPDSSQGSSGMDSHCFELMIPQEDCVVCKIAKTTQLGMLKTGGGGFYTIFNKLLKTVCNDHHGSESPRAF